STQGTNIFSELTAVVADGATASTESQQGKKRPAPVVQIKEINDKSKPNSKQTPSIILKSSGQPKFVSAAEVARTNLQVMVEISDEELLEMAIRFEKKHPN
ncbi:unnamed protein product, partial [Adineta ricciae]